MAAFDLSKQTIVRLVITLIVLAGIAAAVWLLLGVLGVSIPAWVISLFWIVVVVFVGVVVVRFLASLWSE